MKFDHPTYNDKLWSIFDILPWGDDERRRARAEGWDVFSNSDGSLSIQRFDERSPFGNDVEAARHVANAAEDGGTLHTAALMMIARHIVYQSADWVTTINLAVAKASTHRPGFATILRSLNIVPATPVTDDNKPEPQRGDMAKLVWDNMKQALTNRYTAELRERDRVAGIAATKAAAKKRTEDGLQELNEMRYLLSSLPAQKTATAYTGPLGEMQIKFVWHHDKLLALLNRGEMYGSGAAYMSAAELQKWVEGIAAQQGHNWSPHDTGRGWVVADVRSDGAFWVYPPGAPRVLEGVTVEELLTTLSTWLAGLIEPASIINVDKVEESFYA